jgi:hypothetical protein
MVKVNQKHHGKGKEKNIFVQKSKEFQPDCQSVLKNPRSGPKLARSGPRRPDRYSNKNGDPMAFNSKLHLLPCMETNFYVIFNIFKDDIHILTCS